MHYKHIISLGYFCSTAMELERLGLRDGSYPFDWLVSSWTGIEQMIRTNFEGFLDYDSLAQYKNDASAYLNIKTGMAFYHDFNKYDSLSSQLPAVKEKYKRRIFRFYESIKEPTLFVHYISSENGTVELDYLEKNIDSIISLFKSYNPDNDIIWIANSELKSEVIQLFSVDVDENDYVARRPADINRELFEMLNGICISGKEGNILLYEKKQKEKQSFIRYVKNVMYNIFMKYFHKEYVHDKQCDALIP